MKYKLIALGLVCCLFTGCAPEGEVPLTDDTTVTTEGTDIEDPDVTLPPIQKPQFPNAPEGGIGEVTEQYTVTEGDKPILNVTLILPVASVVGDEALQNTLQSRLSAMEEQLRNEVDLLYQQYLRDYEAGRVGLTTPSVQVRFDLHYFTSEAVSMTYIFTETTWDGMVNTHSYHSNLDLRVGSEIRLASLLKDETTSGFLTAVSQKLSAEPPQGLYENAERILNSGLESFWYISAGSLTVLLEPGQIAPVSSGTIRLTFSEGELDGLLSDYGKALL